MQTKKQRFGSKIVCVFSIILILKRIMTFQSQESMHFIEQK